MIERLPHDSPHLLGFRASGKLNHEDFQRDYLPLVAAKTAGGEIGILIQFADDFAGWDLHSIWDEVCYHTKYARSLKRMALVGDATWQEWLAKMTWPIPFLEVRYFHVAEIDAAWKWLDEGKHYARNSSDS